MINNDHVFFIGEAPDFEGRHVFSTYWIRVERSIQYDTGVVVYRGNRGRTPVCSVSDWIELLGGSKSSVYEFISLCVKKGYMAKMTCRGKTSWVANPKYIWNGNLVPQNIHDQFKEFISE